MFEFMVHLTDKDGEVLYSQEYELLSELLIDWPYDEECDGTGTLEWSAWVGGRHVY